MYSYLKGNQLQGMYDRLGNILRDKLGTDEDPFDTWEPASGKSRQAGNLKGKTPPPRASATPERVSVPPELVEDFKILGVLPGVSLEECKKSWKLLLKKNHPDRYALEPEKLAQVTFLCTKINNAYRRIKHWFETGKIS